MAAWNVTFENPSSSGRARSSSAVSVTPSLILNITISWTSSPLFWKLKIVGPAATSALIPVKEYSVPSTSTSAKPQFSFMNEIISPYGSSNSGVPGPLSALAMTSSTVARISSGDAATRASNAGPALDGSSLLAAASASSSAAQKASTSPPPPAELASGAALSPVAAVVAAPAASVVAVSAALVEAPSSSSSLPQAPAATVRERAAMATKVRDVRPLALMAVERVTDPRSGPVS